LAGESLLVFIPLPFPSSADSGFNRVDCEGINPVEPERRDGVFLKLLDARNSNAVTINPDFGCVKCPAELIVARTRCLRP